MFCYSTGNGLAPQSQIASLQPAFNRIWMSDRNLNIVQEEDTATLDHFLAVVERNAYRIALYALHDHHLALDVVQDSMLKLVEKYQSKPTGSWSALFYRILRNRITDIQRRNLLHDRLGKMLSLFVSRDSSENRSEHDMLESGAGVEMNSPVQQPERKLQSQELGQQIQAALERLPERQCQTFILREWQGLSVQETATALGCSAGTIKQHHFRALQMLRKQLTDLDHEYD